MYRRKQLTTSYQFYHGYSLHKPKKANIFEFTSLQKVVCRLIQLDLARPLTQTTVTFIDNWLRSGDKK